MSTGGDAEVDVWLLDRPVRYVDGLGRALGWSGVALLAEVTQVRTCPAADCPCRPQRLPDERWRCPACAGWWSVAQVAGFGAVAHSAKSVGIDIEDRRHRPHALRRASEYCAVTLTGPEQWTQGEALWKALGWGRRVPRAGEIPVPPAWAQGWQVSRDDRWWLYTDGSGPYPWSVALPHLTVDPPSLDVAWTQRSSPPIPGLEAGRRESEDRPTRALAQ